MKEIVLIKPTYNDEIELWVSGDWNDGDEVEETTILTVEQYNKIIPIYQYLFSLKKRHNFKTFDVWETLSKLGSFNEEELDEIAYLFLGTVPTISDGDIHTICNIQAWFLSKEDSIRYIIKI